MMPDSSLRSERRLCRTNPQTDARCLIPAAARGTGHACPEQSRGERRISLAFLDNPDHNILCSFAFSHRWSGDGQNLSWNPNDIRNTTYEIRNCPNHRLHADAALAAPVSREVGWKLYKAQYSRVLRENGVAQKEKIAGQRRD